MIDNFYDRPSNLFKQIDSLLHTIGKWWRSSNGGEAMQVERYDCFFETAYQDGSTEGLKLSLRG